MANIKVQQKFNKETFEELYKQIRSGEVRIIKQVSPDDDLSTDDLLGKVHNAFNLGRKVEAIVAMGAPEPKGSSYEFVKRSGIYYLMRSVA